MKRLRIELTNNDRAELIITEEDEKDRVVATGSKAAITAVAKLFANSINKKCSMKLIIDRKCWLRGEGAFNSFLLREKDGKMCCLGFLGLACGVKKSDMLRAGSPCYNMGNWPINLINNSYKLMNINDCAHISDADREEQLKLLFIEMNVELEFIN